MDEKHAKQMSWLAYLWAGLLYMWAGLCETSANMRTVLKVPTFAIICIEHIIGGIAMANGYKIMYFQVGRCRAPWNKLLAETI